MIRIEAPNMQREAHAAEAMARQMPFALSRALNDAAFAVRLTLREEMARTFDRPTPFTMNAWQVVPASRSNLHAEVRTKDMPKRHYLDVQAEGGQRPRKRIEGAIDRRTDYAGIVAAVIPGDAAKLDRYGNWSRAERNRVLSALGAQSDAAANTTDRSRKRNKGRATYFIPKHGLPPGIYKREPGKPRGQDISIVAIITSNTPQYAPIFRWKEAADETARKTFAEAWPKRLAEAVASAR